jgi:hypothetical protein
MVRFGFLDVASRHSFLGMSLGSVLSLSHSLGEGEVGPPACLFVHFAPRSARSSACYDHILVWVLYYGVFRDMHFRMRWRRGGVGIERY